MSGSAKFDVGRQARLSLPVIPAAFVGMVLGLAGLGADWRAGAGAWGLPPAIGESIYLLAGFVWAAVTLATVLSLAQGKLVRLAALEHAKTIPMTDE